MSEGGELGGALPCLARRTGPQGRDAPSLALPLQRAGDRASLDWACHPGAGGRHVNPFCTRRLTVAQKLGTGC